MKLLKRVYYTLTKAPYWEGIRTGIRLGELFERERIAQVIRDEFVDLPPGAYSVTKPEDLAEYLITRFNEGANRD